MRYKIIIFFYQAEKKSSLILTYLCGERCTIHYINIMRQILLVVAVLIVVALGCINRQDAITRAMAWVSAHIPYNASAYHHGYIQGCEGLVGDAWQFPTPGIPSWDLIPQGYCTQTTKDQLEKGDILTCPHQHELLFDGWVDSSKSRYYGIEEAGDVGSTRRSIPWPYFGGSSCYLPCRVKKACV